MAAVGAAEVAVLRRGAVVQAVAVISTSSISISSTSSSSSRRSLKKRIFSICPSIWTSRSM